MKKIIYKKVRIVILILLLHINKSFSQDVHFSQFREVPLLLNPGRAGLEKDLRIIINYKDQWRSVAKAYKTFAFSADMALNKKKKDNYLGLGINVYSDKSGDADMGLTVGSLNLAGVIKTSAKSKLGIGIMAGFGHRFVNYNSLQWEDQYVNGAYSSTATTAEPITVNSYTLPDAAAGVCWNYSKEEQYISANNTLNITVGAAAHHFGFQRFSFYKQTNEKLFTKFIGHTNVAWGVPNSNLIIVPGFMIAYQGPSKEYIGGSHFKYILSENSKYTGIKKASMIGIGFDYRFGDAAIASLTYEMSNFAVGFSYDINLSKLKVASTARGGFEISLRYVTPNPFTKNNHFKSRI